MRYMLALVFTIGLFLDADAVFGQGGPGGSGGGPVASFCARADGTVSCADLYGAWPGNVNNGCHGIQACEPYMGEMECSGWSVRVDKFVGMTLHFWNLGRLKLRAANVNEAGLESGQPINHECFVMHTCFRECVLKNGVWKCEADFAHPIPFNVTEATLTQQVCVGPPEA